MNTSLLPIYIGFRFLLPHPLFTFHISVQFYGKYFL